MKAAAALGLEQHPAVIPRFIRDFKDAVEGPEIIWQGYERRPANRTVVVRFFGKGVLTLDTDLIVKLPNVLNTACFADRMLLRVTLEEPRDIDYKEGMDIAAVIKPAADLVGLTVAEFLDAADQYKAAKAEATARETTGRATVEPRPPEDSVSAEPDAEPHAAAPAEVTQSRPKWKPVLGLTAAQFAAQAYAPEIADGTFDKSLVRREDRTLYRLLFREKAWGELAALTETSIPTKSERRLAEQIEAVRAMGLPVEEVERAAAGIKEARALANRLAQKLPLG